jgi:predicted TIM-barrel fold metal-dependent hydrolase
MIVDTHAHMGWDYTFDEDFTRAELVEKMDVCRVDVQVVQPSTCHDIDSVRAQHDAIAALASEYPGRFFGMANPSPHLPGTLYEEEIARCIEELGFVGIKINPLACGVNPNSRAGRKGFNAGRKHGVPVMVHTGMGIPFASPVNLITLAKEYTDVKIILAHCGQTILANEAEVAFGACPNIYGETSWTPGFVVKKWMREYGNRFMMGSDQANNTAAEIKKYETLGLSRKDRDAVYSETALEVFKLRARAAQRH